MVLTPIRVVIEMDARLILLGIFSHQKGLFFAGSHCGLKPRFFLDFLVIAIIKIRFSLKRGEREQTIRLCEN
jgi:hypothetical protein